MPLKSPIAIGRKEYDMTLLSPRDQQALRDLSQTRFFPYRNMEIRDHDAVIACSCHELPSFFSGVTAEYTLIRIEGGPMIFVPITYPLDPEEPVRIIRQAGRGMKSGNVIHLLFHYPCSFCCQGASLKRISCFMEMAQGRVAQLYLADSSRLSVLLHVAGEDVLYKLR